MQWCATILSDGTKRSSDCSTGASNFFWLPRQSLSRHPLTNGVQSNLLMNQQDRSQKSNVDDMMSILLISLTLEP
eukprot:2053143-Amphidinium_carterae.1